MWPPSSICDCDSMLNFVRVAPLPSSACKLIHLQSPTSNTSSNLQTYLRAGEAPSTGLTEALVALGFETDRLKTGTPSRVDTRTIDYSQLEKQPGDADVRWFSFDPEVRSLPLPSWTSKDSDCLLGSAPGGTSPGHPARKSSHRTPAQSWARKAQTQPSARASLAACAANTRTMPVVTN